MAFMSLEQYAEVIDRNFSDYTRGAWESTPAEYPDFVKEKQVPGRWITKMGGVQGIQGPIENRDVENLPFFNPVKSYTTAISPKFFRAAWAIERALIEFSEDRDAPLDNLTDIMTAEKTMRDRRASNLLNNGTSAQGYEPVEADGTRRALFSTAHVREDGGATISNYYNVGVPPNLDTIYEVGMNYLYNLRDSVGNPIGGFTELTIITPVANPAFVKAADVIVASMDDPSTANRAVNTARTRFRLKHVALRHLTSTTAWYLSISTSANRYPLMLLNYSSPQTTPLEKMANNPDVMYSRIRSVFNVGLGPTFRGIVRIGT